MGDSTVSFEDGFDLICLRIVSLEFRILIL